MLDAKASERFWSKVHKHDGPETFCWIWTAGLDAHGYGQFGFNKKPTKAHRVAYEELVSPPPSGMALDHLCRVRNCVNPAHLEPVSIGENVRRGDGVSARNAKKTHCPSGHELQGENLIVEKSGTRRCKECHYRRNRERNKKQ